MMIFRFIFLNRVSYVLVITDINGVLFIKEIQCTGFNFI